MDKPFYYLMLLTSLNNILIWQIENFLKFYDSLKHKIILKSKGGSLTCYKKPKKKNQKPQH